MKAKAKLELNYDPVKDKNDKFKENNQRLQRFKQ